MIIRIWAILLSGAAISMESCDPSDTRLRIHNLSDEPIYYLTLSHDTLPRNLGNGNGYLGRGIYSFAFPARGIAPDSIKVILHSTNWELHIDQSPRGMKYIFIFGQSDLESYTWREIVENKIYTVDSFTVERLDAIDWTIEYLGKTNKE